MSSHELESLVVQARKLTEEEQLELIRRVTDLLEATKATDDHIELRSLTLEVLLESLRASTLPEMHDRLIVGTALYLQSAGHTGIPTD